MESRVQLFHLRAWLTGRRRLVGALTGCGTAPGKAWMMAHERRKNASGDAEMRRGVASASHQGPGRCAVARRRAPSLCACAAGLAVTQPKGGAAVILNRPSAHSYDPTVG